MAQQYLCLSTAVQLAILVLIGIQEVFAGFIDMDTPLHRRTTKSLIDGSTYHLVSSSW